MRARSDRRARFILSSSITLDKHLIIIYIGIVGGGMHRDSLKRLGVPNMKRSDIEKDLADRFNLQPSQSEQILDTIIEHMTGVLENGGRIEIRGFGSFFTKSYGSYEGRNPRTGDKVTVSSKKLPHFRPSRELIAKLNGEEE